MPVGPSGVSWISAFHFRNCRSLDELWLFQVGPASFKYGRAVGSAGVRNHETFSAMQACPFCVSTLAVSSIILFHMFVHRFDKLKILVNVALEPEIF